jgi:hypothetical protein
MGVTSFQLKIFAIDGVECQILTYLGAGICDLVVMCDVFLVY